jgi:hypothetical protein
MKHSQRGRKLKVLEGPTVSWSPEIYVLSKWAPPEPCVAPVHPLNVALARQPRKVLRSLEVDHYRPGRRVPGTA